MRARRSTFPLGWLAIVVSLAVPVGARADLVARWEFDGDLTDSRGDHDGSYIGVAPFFVEDRDGEPDAAISFDESGEVVEIPDAADLTLPGDFTFSLWIKLGALGQAEKYFLSKHNGSQFAIIYGYTPNSLDFFAPGAIGVNPRADGASEMLLDDTDWHHVAYSKTGAIWSGYIDGEQVFSIEREFTLNSFAANWYIGAARPDGVNSSTPPSTT